MLEVVRDEATFTDLLHLFVYSQGGAKESRSPMVFAQRRILKKITETLTGKTIKKSSVSLYSVSVKLQSQI